VVTTMAVRVGDPKWQWSLLGSCLWVLGWGYLPWHDGGKHDQEAPVGHSHQRSIFLFIRYGWDGYAYGGWWDANLVRLKRWHQSEPLDEPEPPYVHR
jgi:hypothetical protein